MDAGARYSLAEPVEEHRLGCGPSFGLRAQLVERGLPERAAALFAPFARNADRSRVPVDVTDPELSCFACARAGVKHEQ